MGSSKSKREENLCSYISYSLTNINTTIQNFWKLESYGTLPNMLPELLLTNEKRLF